jgi:hypothetical protein
MLRCLNGVTTTKPGHETWKRARDIDRWVVLHAVPYIRKSLSLGTPKEPCNPECLPGSDSETVGRFCDGLGSNICSVGPFITSHGRIIARENVDRLGNQVHPMILQTLFPNSDAVFQDDTAWTVQSRFERKKVNFGIFLGQHNHQVWTSLNHSVQFWRLEWGTGSHLQHL